MVRVLRPYLAVGMLLGLAGLLPGGDAKLNKPIRELGRDLEGGGRNLVKLLKPFEKTKGVDAADVMYPLGYRIKNGKANPDAGLGIGAKPGAVKHDGIEAMISDLARRQLNANELAALGADLEQAGYDTLAAAHAVTNHCTKPAKIVLWNNYVEQFQKGSQSFIVAVQGRQPAAIKAAAFKLDGICISCHNDFK